MWFYYDVDDFTWTKQELIDVAHENLMNKEELDKFLADWNDNWDTDYQTVDDFNKGEEYRKIIGWEEFIQQVCMSAIRYNDLIRNTILKYA